MFQTMDDKIGETTKGQSQTKGKKNALHSKCTSSTEYIPIMLIWEPHSCMNLLFLVAV
jgi:hypothetical protein